MNREQGGVPLLPIPYSLLPNYGVAMAAKTPNMSDLNIFTSERPLVLFLLAYRWASLLLAMGLLAVDRGLVLAANGG